MANVTVSIDDEVLKRTREYAAAHGLSLNALIRVLLERTVSSPSADDELFALMDKLKADSKGKRWTRDELYDV
jgi:antitoxin component of RelBE/YafQ-DinJ toxin-antitoxin module